MEYKIIWQPTANTTFYEEIDFIFLKWNSKEVLKFIDLVKTNLVRLSENPALGRYEVKFKLNSFVISKQTTLYYRFFEDKETIELFVFWNNSKNPNDLIKLL